jgi:NarL family two-component system response regulator LiaR
MAEPITVLVVDDHALVRQGIRAFLEAQDDIILVGEAACGEEAIRLCKEHVPDVALIDLVMPGMNGVEVTRHLKQISPRTHLIILTSFHEEEHLFPAIQAGAQSYLLKDINPSELIDAIRKAYHGEVTLHPRVAAQVIQALRGGSNSIESDHELTEREFEVLRLLAKGMTNTEIAESLVISIKTVKSHVSNILSKLHLADRTQAAVYAWREGLVKRDKS